MSDKSFVFLASLRDEPIFRSTSGRNFTAPFDLADGTSVRVCVQDLGYENGPHLIRVVNEDQSVLAEACIVPNTSQVFRSLSLLVHFRPLPP